jgi:hypothetical protein
MAASSGSPSTGTYSMQGIGHSRIKPATPRLNDHGGAFTPDRLRSVLPPPRGTGHRQREPLPGTATSRGRTTTTTIDHTGPSPGSHPTNASSRKPRIRCHRPPSVAHRVDALALVVLTALGSGTEHDAGEQRQADTDENCDFYGRVLTTIVALRRPVRRQPIQVGTAERKLTTPKILRRESDPSCSGHTPGGVVQHGMMVR